MILFQVSKLVDLSLEELMNIKVVTVGGYPQKLSEAPSTMNVITAKRDCVLFFFAGEFNEGYS